jgi:hypothetical protein
MLDAFASVGARVFDLSIIDMKRDKVKGQQRTGSSLDEMRRTIGRVLQDSERNRHNVIIRPRSTTALLIQLDDMDDAKAAQIEGHAFMTIRTSPGNGQVWIAVSDGPKESDEEAARDFKTRVRRGAGADHSATGATRIAGSLNFKSEYAPDFPRVEITRLSPGSMTTVAALEQAGLIAPAEVPAPTITPPASVPLSKMRRPGPIVTGPQHWPDYDRALRGAPLKHKPDGTTQRDRSMADYMFCRWAAQRGHSIDAIAAKLAEVSERAQETQGRSKLFPAYGMESAQRR